MIALKECYSEVLWFIMVEMRRGVFCFIFRDSFHDSHPHAMIPDPMYSSVPFPLMPQLGVNNRYQLPKMGCRSQDKASFFQSGNHPYM